MRYFIIFLNCGLQICSLRRDTRFKQAQKLQTSIAIQASKTCKVWILLNPSMCYSGCFWDTGRRSSVFLKFYRVLMTLLWYSSYWKIPPFQHEFSFPFIVCFLGLHGTSDFSLLPLRAHAVTVAQGLVSSIFSHNFHLLLLFL